MTTKLELHNVAISTTSVELDQDNLGQIPPNLAKLTDTILKIHKVNGDLAWIQDMAHDLEVQQDFSMQLSNMRPSTLTEIAKGFIRALAATDDPDEIVDIETHLSFVRGQLSSLVGIDETEQLLRHM